MPFIFLCLSGCGFSPSLALPLIVTSDTVTIEWDPSPVRINAPEQEILSYKVFISPHKLELWNLVTEVPASDNPSITLSYMKDGEYDIGVRAVTVGDESPLHSSLDFSAYPYGGWYIIWYLDR